MCKHTWKCCIWGKNTLWKLANVSSVLSQIDPSFLQEYRGLGSEEGSSWLIVCHCVFFYLNIVLLEWQYVWDQCHTESWNCFPFLRMACLQPSTVWRRVDTSEPLVDVSFGPSLRLDRLDFFPVFKRQDFQIFFIFSSFLGLTLLCPSHVQFPNFFLSTHYT